MDEKKIAKKRNAEPGAVGSNTIGTAGENGANKKSKKKKVIRIVVIVLCVIIAIVLILLAIAYAIFKKYYNKTNYIPDDDASITTMAHADISKEVEQGNNDIIKPIQSSIYESISKSVDAESTDTDMSSVYESVKQSVEEGEESSIHEEKYESLVNEEVSKAVEANPGLTPEEIRASIEADEAKKQELESQASSEAAEEIESKASSIAESRQEEIESEYHSSVQESISKQASESASEIVSSIDEAIESQSKEMESREPVSDSDVYNVLLIGVDMNNYSDTIMLLSINKTNKTIYLTSLLRDTRVNLEGFGAVKLNNSYRFGGAPLLVSTVEKNFGVKIDNYAFINFASAIAMFDYAGGIDINITDAEVKQTNNNLTHVARSMGLDPEDYYVKESGRQHLNGMQALGYCRIRKIGNTGDAGRTKRQRTALTALFNKVKGFSLGELDTFLDNVLPFVSHNIPSGTMLGLVMNAGDYVKYNLSTLVVPVSGTYSVSVEDDYMLWVDLVTNAKYLKETIYGK